MSARWNWFARTSGSGLSLRTLLLGVTATAVLGGCTEAAGLHEHEHYRGFPDSASAPCSNGTLFLDCGLLETSAPQDGHTLNAPPAYRLTEEDTVVVDDVTGLSWYRAPGDPQSHAQGVKYCDALPGNYRLPTRIELISLFDFTPFSQTRIDRKIFPDVQATYYWTASSYGTEGDFWAVDFCNVCNPDYTVKSSYFGNEHGVLCVKSPDEPFAPGPFHEAGVENKYLRDTRTGLMWMKTPKRNMNDWVDSLIECEKAPDGGYNDFRTPNIKELATLVDDSKTGPTSYSIHAPFDIEVSETIWSSTPYPKAGEIFVLNTTGGSIGHQKGNLTYLWNLCVRGPD